MTEFWKTLSQRKIGDGWMDFSTDLTLNGYTVRELTQSGVGTASLRGDNLTLAIGDLDRELSVRYESTQRFDLIDVGAFLVAGPLGVAVTKGYDFARVSVVRVAGRSEIPRFNSEWQIEHGVAKAKDVAMTTRTNRLRAWMLDFVGDRFQDVTVALVDEHGCVRVEQNVRGPFAKPDVQKPNVLVVGDRTGGAQRSSRRSIWSAGTAKCSMRGRCRRRSETDVQVEADRVVLAGGLVQGIF